MRMLWLVVPWVVLLFPADGRAADTIESRLERIEAKMLTREEFKLFVESQDKRFEAMQKHMDQRFEGIHQRFEAMQKYMDQRFEGINQRFEDINQRFEDMNQRFEDMNRRFEFLQALLLALLTVVVGSTIYNVWDRRRESDLKQRVERIESELRHVSASRAPGR